MDKFAQLKNEYSALSEFIRRTAQPYNHNDFLLYILSGTIMLWASFGRCAPDYSKALAAISGNTYTIAQTTTAMSCCSGKNCTLRVPKFFENMVLHDKAYNSAVCREYIENLTAFFLDISSVNGDFTAEEAAKLAEIIDDLNDYCVCEGVPADKSPADFSDRITPVNEKSYLYHNTNDAVRQSCDDDTSEHIADIQKNSININLTMEVRPLESEENDDSEYSGKETDKHHMPHAEAEKPEQEANKETLETLLAELDSLVGLETVKNDVHSLMNFIKVSKMRESRGMKVPVISYHLVFTGNPGTGKTTVARLVAQLYFHMGILAKGQLVETDRSSLVAGYLGQTAIKTQKVINQALGGVLFIDEAYSLAENDNDCFGREAIETLLKGMEDHRDELVVIVAGYDALMHKFIDSNPGLASRFSKYFFFPDYNGVELQKIFLRFCDSNGYLIDEETRNFTHNKFDEMFEKREEHFGNARAIRNIFEKAINCQANRLAGLISLTNADLEKITLADMTAAVGGV